MSYIEREKALEFVLNNTPHINGETTMKCVERAIKAIPTADVVEVVRCRDCIHNRDNGGDCDRTIILNEYDSTEYRCAGLEYCSYGERRDDGT